MDVNANADVESPLPPSGGFVSTRINIEATPQKRQKSRRNVSLCLDTSSSMSGSKIEELRDAAKEVLDMLNGEDYISVVSFSSQADVVLEPVRYGDTPEGEIESKIDSLHAGGLTELYNGVETAANEVSLVDDKGTVNRIVLLTDGRGNRASETDAYEDLGERVSDMEISIVTGGIGNYHEEAVMALSDSSGGTARHIDSPEDIHGFLESTIEEAGKVVVKDPHLRIESGDRFIIPAAHSGYENSSGVYRTVQRSEDEFERQVPSVSTEDGALIVDLADLASERRQSIFVDFLGQRMTAGLSYTVAEVEVISAEEVVAREDIEVEYSEEVTEEDTDEELQKDLFVSKVVAGRNDEDTSDEAVKRLIESKKEEKPSWDETIKEVESIEKGVEDRDPGIVEIEDPFE